MQAITGPRIRVSNRILCNGIPRNFSRNSVSAEFYSHTEIIYNHVTPSLSRPRTRQSGRGQREDDSNGGSIEPVDWYGTESPHKEGKKRMKNC